MIQTDNNAMTEVSLALAMAFFAIFILAAVSMSQNKPSQIQASSIANSLDTHQLLFDVNSKSVHSNKNLQALENPLKNEDFFLIYYKGSFYDQQLNPVISPKLTENKTRLVIGITDEVKLSELLNIKNEKNFPNLAITLLSPAWKEKLGSTL